MIKKVHHVALVVQSVEEALHFYKDGLGLEVKASATVKDQGVKAVLLAAGESEIELIEPLEKTSGVGRFLGNRGESMHHICLETDNIDSEMGSMRIKGMKLIDSKPRQGLAGRVCFIHPCANDGVLIELAQPEGAASEG